MTLLTGISSKTIAELIPPRSSQSRTGDNGIVLAVGGNSLYHGAPILAAIAAFRSGVDLVYTAVPRSILYAVRSFSPVLMVLPFGSDGLTKGSSRELIAQIPKRVNAAAIGMGMTIEPGALLNLISSLRQTHTRILLDASALVPQVLEAISETESIVTPHAGEFKRLFGYPPGTSEKEIIHNVEKVSKEYGITIALKGYLNVVSDGEQTAGVKRSTPAMTVGGTGDVLSGLAAGLLARNMKPFDAAVAALYINGVAARIAFRQKGLHVVATDLLDRIPEAFRPFDRIT